MYNSFQTRKVSGCAMASVVSALGASRRHCHWECGIDLPQVCGPGTNLKAFVHEGSRTALRMCPGQSKASAVSLSEGAV